MQPFLIIGIILLISAYPSVCKEIACTYGPDGLKPVGQADLTEYKGTDVISFAVSRGPSYPSGDPSTSYKPRSLDSIKKEINQKVDKGNEAVRDEGLSLVGSRSGSKRIDQITSIYDYMVGNWTFVDDWSNLEQFQYANYTLKKGNEVGRSGKGDCDDFSILLASLIESIGGTPRIIFAYNPAGGHAYTEVYLGKNNSKDLDMMMWWLRTTYNANDVNIHADLENGDVWLNMDWWKDSGSEKHPGGPFYHATAQTLVYTPDKNGPLTPIENLPPIALFNYSPIQPKVDEMVSFNAAQSKDPDGKIVDYEWNFGDEDTLHSSSKSVSSHVYLSSGPFQVNLTITDNQGDKSSEVMGVNVIDRTASSSNVTQTDSEIDWIKKGDALNKLGRYIDAIQAYDKAINLNPRSFEAWTDKGNVFDSLGRYDEAIQAYNKAIEIYPNYDRAKASKELAQYNKDNAQYEASKPKGIPVQETNSGIPGYHWPGM